MQFGIGIFIATTMRGLVAIEIIFHDMTNLKNIFSVN